jgi:hypothetical protein
MSRKDSDPGDKWVRRQAAKHTTPASIRQQIDYERGQIRILTGTGLGGDFPRALDAHQELIRVLSERLSQIATNGPSDL